MMSETAVWMSTVGLVDDFRRHMERYIAAPARKQATANMVIFHQRCNLITHNPSTPPLDPKAPICASSSEPRRIP